MPPEDLKLAMVNREPNGDAARGVQYCPSCGSPTASAIPAGDNVPRPVCTSCGHVAYINPTVLVACILHDKDRILWIKRSEEPYAGKWALPGGFMECGESVEQAACRELLEETRLTVLPQDFEVYGVVSIALINQVYILLTAALPSRRFEITRETLDIRLLSQVDVDTVDFAYPPSVAPLIREMYKRLAARRLSGGPALLADVHGSRPSEPCELPPGRRSNLANCAATRPSASCSESAHRLIDLTF